MTSFNTSSTANSAFVSTFASNNTITNNTMTNKIVSRSEFVSVIAPKVSSSKLIEILAELDSILEYCNEVVTTVSVGASYSNPKTKKGKKVARVVSTKETGNQVVDTARTIASKRQFMASTLASLEVSTVSVETVKVADVAIIREAAKAKAQVKVDRARSAAYARQLNARKGEIAHVTAQLELARSVNVSRVSMKARKKDAPKVSVKAPRIRSTVKPLGKAVAYVRPNHANVQLAPIVVRPFSSTVKVTRAEAQALLASTNNEVKANNSVSTFAVIKAMTRLADFVLIALTDVASGRAFLRAAKARLESTVKSLPQVAQTMTMQANLTKTEILNQVHAVALQALNNGQFDDYEDAVLETYEETVANLDIYLTEELEDDIFYIANTGCLNQVKEETVEHNSIDNGAEEKLDKNLNESTENTQVINEDTMTNFESAFNAPYSDVEAIISYGDTAAFLHTFDGEGTSLASQLAKVIFRTSGKSAVANVSPEAQARADRRNAKAAEDRAAFLAKFESALGYVRPAAIAYEANTAFVKGCPSRVKAFFADNFAIKKYNKKGEYKLSGRTDYEFKSSITVKSTALSVWVSILAQATSRLTVADRAELLGFLFSKVAHVNGNVVTRGSISFDLANGTVNTANRSLKANKASCLGSVNGDFFVVDGLHAVFLLALSALGGSDKQLETSINLAVKLFNKEHNYGHKPDADDISFFVRDNLVYSNGINSRMNFPCFEIIGGKQAPNFLGWVLEQGIPAISDKNNGKFVSINDGAVATGMGFTEEGEVRTANDVNKVSKLTNRNAANNYDCADLPDRVASNFGFALPSGKVAKTKGKLLNVAFTNSISGFGSGVAAFNPNSSFTYIVGKKEKEVVNFSIFGKAAINNEAFKNNFVDAVNAEFKRAMIEERAVAPKGVIISLNIGGKELPLVTNSSDAATVVVRGGSVKFNPRNVNEVEVVAEVDIVETSRWVKTRRFATKCTTLPYDIKGFTGEWDIMLNNECTKGQGALLEMFANASGINWGLNSATGELISENGDVVNLFDSNNAFETWKEANIVSQTISYEMAKSTYEAHAVLVEDGKNLWAQEITVVEDKGDRVVVEETMDVIFGQLVFDVEISTALESVSKSNFTLESAAAISLQSKELGSALFQECINKTEKFNALVEAYAINKAMPKFDVLNEELRAGVINSVFPNGTAGLKQRNIIAKIAKVYSNGINFVVGTQELAMDLGIIANFGSFSPTTGSASRETADIVNFVIDVFVNDAANAANLITDASYGFNRLVKTGVDSKNVLKKPTRSGSLVYGKVRTSYHPMLNSVDGIPTIVMNVECPIVRLLGIPTDGSIVDYFVGFSRTPMPFLGAARVRLTDDQNICGNAHVLVDPLVWHALNEGDSDGDGIAVINLETVKGFNVTKAEVKAINEAKMGIGGYRYLYGEDLPYVDFVSIGDKEGKKSFKGYKCLINSDIKDPRSGEMVKITRSFFGEFAEAVAKHYKSAVGISYGICSKLIFDAVDVSASGNEALANTLIDASLIAWRMLYEGLGLSGYSANAAKVFEILNYASVDHANGLKLFKSPEGVYDVRFGHGDNELVAGYDELANATGDLRAVFEKVGRAPFVEIIGSRSVTRVMPKLEGRGEMKEYWAPLAVGAVRFGALRRISQGDDIVDEIIGHQEEAELASEGEFVAKPLSRFFVERIDVSTQFGSAQLGELARKVCSFHATLVSRKQELVDLANAGQ